MLKILITGGGGSFGYYLNERLNTDFDILTIYHNHSGNCEKFNSVKADLTDHARISKIFIEFNPDVVVHAAAVSKVNQALAMPSKDVYAINVLATQNLAELCRQHNAKLIYISTDLVYAGYRGTMLKEDAKLIPVSLYAETKLLGEVKIREALENHVIIRMALMYGIGHGAESNYFDVMYRKFKAGEKVRLFHDQYRTPLAFFDAAELIAKLIETGVKNETINFGGIDKLSRLQMGEILCETAGFDMELIESSSMNELKNYPAVADVSMNTEKMQSFGLKAKSYSESLKIILNELNKY